MSFSKSFEQQLQELAFLWDGSQPHWKLQHIDYALYWVTFLFAESGPTATEIIGIRKTLDEFRDQPMQQVLSKLRAKNSYKLLRSLTNLEMRSLVEEANEHGLKVTVDGRQTGGYVLISPDMMAFLIEDEKLRAAAIDRMIAAGVPVEHIHVD